MLNRLLSARGSCALVGCARLLPTILVIGCSVLLYALWRTNSTSLILPFLLGKAIVFTPPNVIVGDVGVNQEVSTKVSVFNLSNKPVTLVGAHKSCRCLSVDSFPIVIPSGKEHSINLKLVAPGKQSEFKYDLGFYTNDANYVPIIVSLSGYAR